MKFFINPIPKILPSFRGFTCELYRAVAGSIIHNEIITKNWTYHNHCTYGILLACLQYSYVFQQNQYD